MLTKKENTKNASKPSKNGKTASPPSAAKPSSQNSSTACCSHSAAAALQEKPTSSSSPSASSQRPAHQSAEARPSLKTRITVKYDAGFPNQLYIRGSGANLNWKKGMPLKNVKADEWVWESELPFMAGEFKVLINDQVYEAGDNHPLHPGSTLLYTPRFQPE